MRRIFTGGVVLLVLILSVPLWAVFGALDGICEWAKHLGLEWRGMVTK